MSRSTKLNFGDHEILISSNSAGTTFIQGNELVLLKYEDMDETQKEIFDREGNSEVGRILASMYYLNYTSEDISCEVIIQAALMDSLVLRVRDKTKTVAQEYIVNRSKLSRRGFPKKISLPITGSGLIETNFDKLLDMLH